MKDRDTGKPRGFGFVTFESEDAVEKVIANLKDHKLLDKWVECKKATPSKTNPPHVSASPSHIPSTNPPVDLKLIVRDPVLMRQDMVMIKTIMDTLQDQ